MKESISVEEDKVTALQEILQSLKAHMPGSEEMICLRQDGTVLAHVQASRELQQAVAVMTSFVNAAEQARLTLERDDFSEVVLRGQKRFVALYKIHDQYVLGVSGPTANMGLCNRACWSAVQKLEAVLS